MKKADMCYSSDTTKRTNLILELTKVRFAGGHLPKDHFTTAHQIFVIDYLNFVLRFELSLTVVTVKTYCV